MHHEAGPEGDGCGGCQLEAGADPVHRHPHASHRVVRVHPQVPVKDVRRLHQVRKLVPFAALHDSMGSSRTIQPASFPCLSWPGCSCLRLILIKDNMMASRDRLGAAAHIQGQACDGFETEAPSVLLQIDTEAIGGAGCQCRVCLRKQTRHDRRDISYPHWVEAHTCAH